MDGNRDLLILDQSYAEQRSRALNAGLQRPLSRAKRTPTGAKPMSAFDPTTDPHERILTRPIATACHACTSGRETGLAQSFCVPLRWLRLHVRNGSHALDSNAGAIGQQSERQGPGFFDLAEQRQCGAKTSPNRRVSWSFRHSRPKTGSSISQPTRYEVSLADAPPRVRGARMAWAHAQRMFEGFDGLFRL
jgi:hypothetical protein